MKTQLLFLALIFISTFAQANAVEDSLIANIGKKAKVIFYAENKADFNEIAKYELNKLFAEVRKRSEKNFSNNEEVTLREADDLKNREVNTTVSTKKWLKSMNLNLFVGGVYTSGGAAFLGPKQEFVSAKYGNMNKYEVTYLNGKTSIMFGMGLFYDKQLYTKKKLEFSLKYGLGFELMSGKMKTANSYVASLTKQISINEYKILNDSLRASSNLIDSPYKTHFSPNLYTQVMPTFNILNRKGEKVINIGIGLKAAINMAGLKRTFVLYPTPNSIHIYPRFKTLQTAWVANIGYKYINVFIQMQPEIGRTRLFRKQPVGENTLTSGIQGTFDTYTIGLRFGK